MMWFHTTEDSEVNFHVEIYMLEVWELGNILRWQINVRQGPNFKKKTISEPQTGIEPATF